MPAATMRSSSDDERASFMSSESSTPPSFCFDNDPDPLDIFEASPSPGEGLLSKLDDHYQSRRSSRWRRYGVRRHTVGCLSRRRRTKRRLFGLLLKSFISFVFSLFIFTPLLLPSYHQPPAHYDELVAQCQARSDGPEQGLDRLNGCANPLDEKVFISVSLYDKDGRLAAGSWGKSVIKLIHLLGPGNVFISIYENNSGHGGATALEQLRELLPCHNSVVYEDQVSLDIIPNITMPDGSIRTKRLAYLSEMRNRALRPLDTLAGVNSMAFDKILFLNDIVFQPLDAAQLLFSTNMDEDGRAQYLSACALDWKNPFLFYDLYAQRDADGFSNGVPIFPLFSGAGAGLSRADMLAQKDAVRVQSCWGGMVAMQAAYVQNLNTSLPRPDFQDVGSHVINPARPTGITVPVRFRYEPEIFFDACECCLFLADVSQAARAAGAPKSETGVFVNPYVRVAYDWNTLCLQPLVQYWETLFAIPHAIVSYFSSLPTHNPHRLVKEGDDFVEEVWNTSSNSWTLETRTGRNGLFCGVREMQLMLQERRSQERNWANAVIPPGQVLNFQT